VKFRTKTWRQKSFDRRIVESIALDALEAAGSRRIGAIAENSAGKAGSSKTNILKARTLTGLAAHAGAGGAGTNARARRHLSDGEGLRDRDPEIRLAALRGLGRTASPQAAEEILAWVSERGLSVPAMPLQKRTHPMLRGASATADSLRATCGRIVA